MYITPTRTATRTLRKELNFLYAKVRRMIWDLTDIISTTSLISHLYAVWCAAPAKTCSPVAIECACAYLSSVCGVAVILNNPEPARRRGCRPGLKFERAYMLRKRSA